MLFQFQQVQLRERCISHKDRIGTVMPKIGPGLVGPVKFWLRLCMLTLPSFIDVAYTNTWNQSSKYLGSAGPNAGTCVFYEWVLLFNPFLCLILIKWKLVINLVRGMCSSRLGIQERAVWEQGERTLLLLLARKGYPWVVLYSGLIMVCSGIIYQLLNIKVELLPTLLFSEVRKRRPKV